MPCGLPALPQFLRQRFKIDVRVNAEVIGIDRAAHTVRVREKGGREYEESYDKLVLSPGGTAKTFGWAAGAGFLRCATSAMRCPWFPICGKRTFLPFWSPAAGLSAWKRRKISFGTG